MLIVILIHELRILLYLFTHNLALLTLSLKKKITLHMGKQMYFLAVYWLDWPWISPISLK